MLVASFFSPTPHREGVLITATNTFCLSFADYNLQWSGADVKPHPVIRLYDWDVWCDGSEMTEKIMATWTLSLASGEIQTHNLNIAVWNSWHGYSATSLYILTASDSASVKLEVKCGFKDELQMNQQAIIKSRVTARGMIINRCGVSMEHKRLSCFLVLLIKA